MKRRNLWLIGLMVLCTAFAGAYEWWTGRSAEYVAAEASAHDELTGGRFITLTDESGRVVMYTCHRLRAGDEFIGEDNRRYEVVEVTGNTARCRFVGSFEISETPPPPAPGIRGMVQAIAASLRATLERFDSLVPVQAGAPKVAIYHTHSDESYLPSEGTETTPGRGGVMKVGERLKEALAKRRIDALHDTTSHEPHDAMAYARSRRTAMKLVGQRPVALFDVHRDAAPPQAYQKEVKGERTTQIMLVLGKQNPKLQTNLEFARRLKSAVDKAHPGLIRGILLASGNFNQDLHDRALLLEVGAHTNDRAEAEKAVEMLADDIPKVIGSAAGPGGTPGTIGTQGRGASRALGGILLVVGVALIAFLAISTGGWKEAFSKLRRLGSEEMAGFLGNRRPKDETAGESKGTSGSNGENDNKGGCGS